FALTGDGVLGQNLGLAVAAAGDVNGDGFGDIIVADLNFNADDGVAYVVFGKAGVFASTIDLTALNGTDGFIINGFDSRYAGRSVSSAGDVNGDGFDDIIIGIINEGFLDSPGESYVIFGKADFSSSPIIELNSLDGSDGFLVRGLSNGDYAGFTVSGAGDVNGDGLDDLIVGAYRDDPNGD
ncbi:MAG: FG-GAP repeat protein, partial [Proteobacteria bacterium]|nr:FG-GAP repeat protein [Pseudomonadota bacterium]